MLFWLRTDCEFRVSRELGFSVNRELGLTKNINLALVPFFYYLIQSYIARDKYEIYPDS
jgi:hypothetical protein